MALLATIGALLVLLGLAVGAWANERFSDVPDGHTFADEISWMADTGITSGYPDGTFRPDDAVTRQAMAAFMQRLAGDDADVGPVVNAAALGGEAAADILDRLDALEAENDQLRALLSGVSRVDADGRDTLRFEGMNVQVVDGSGTTDGSPSGLGNIIIGYDAPRSIGDADRSGSHYLVVGDEHAYAGFGGIVAGVSNSALGNWASVLGGGDNTASGIGSVVSGGVTNTASGDGAAVSGGSGNLASGVRASVTGGRENIASGTESSVASGSGNAATDSWSAVVGGTDNAANGLFATVSGGGNNTAGGAGSSISGGQGNTALGVDSSILGGFMEDMDTNLGIHPSP